MHWAGGGLGRGRVWMWVGGRLTESAHECRWGAREGQASSVGFAPAACRMARGIRLGVALSAPGRKCWEARGSGQGVSHGRWEQAAALELGFGREDEDRVIGVGVFRWTRA